MKRTRKLRAYEPIWNMLKETGACTVAVHQSKVARVKKAVIKEKYMDQHWHENFNGNLSTQVTPVPNDKAGYVYVSFELERISKYI